MAKNGYAKWCWYDKYVRRRPYFRSRHHTPVLDFDGIDNWNNELDNMNEGKEGASYVYPNSFVQLLGYVKYHNLGHLLPSKIISI
jgi:hypothetical protein